MAATKKSSVRKAKDSAVTGTRSSKKSELTLVDQKVNFLGSEDEGQVVIRNKEILGEVVKLWKGRWTYRLIYTIIIDDQGLPVTGLYSGWRDRARTRKAVVAALLEEYDSSYTAKNKKPKTAR